MKERERWFEFLCSHFEAAGALSGNTASPLVPLHLCLCMYVKRLLCTLHLFVCLFTWRFHNCSISLHWLLFFFTFSWTRAPMALSSWLTMRMTTRTMWVLHAHTNHVIFSRLLTLPLPLLSLLSCSLSLVFHTRTHAGKLHNIQPPFVTFAGVIVGETSTVESVSS